MKPNSELTPDEVKSMPLDEFEKRFNFRPVDALEKWCWAMQGKRLDPTSRGAFEAGVIDMPDLENIVME